MVTVALMATGCWSATTSNRGAWTDLADKSYPKDPRVVAAVEYRRSMVVAALDARGLASEANVDLALVVAACESNGNANAPGGGFYQITRTTWAGLAVAERNRYDIGANIDGMAELVDARGWQPWEGGVLSDGTRWGSGPKGFQCWHFPS